MAIQRHPNPRLRMHPRRPRGRPKSEDLHALESRLISVARDAFIVNGYGAVSMNAIAKLARVSKNTLYARFASKAHLFQAIVEQQIASVDAAVPEESEGAVGSLEERLQAYLNAALSKSLTPEILQINRLIVSESSRFPELGASAWDRLQIGIEHVARIIEDAAARDRIPCSDARRAAEALLCTANGWYAFIVTTNRVVSERERRQWVTDAIRLFIDGRRAW